MPSITGLNINYNKEKNGIEIKFGSFPSSIILDNLKSGYKPDRFFWSRRKKIWYAQDNEHNKRTVAKIKELIKDDGGKINQDTKKNTIADNAGISLIQHCSYLYHINKKNEFIVSQHTFKDQYSNIYIKIVSKNRWQRDDEAPIISWLKIGKKGKSKTYFPDSESKEQAIFYFTDLKEYAKIYKDTEKYRFCHKDGWFKSIVTNKQRANTEQRLKALNYQHSGVLFLDKPDSKKIELIKEKIELFENIPKTLTIPKNKQKPLIDLITNIESKKHKTINRLLLFQEVMCGKMEAAKWKYFDGMTDMWESIKDDELVWFDPSTSDSNIDFFYTNYRGAPKIQGTNLIDYDCYYFRYKANQPNLKRKSDKPLDKSKLADKFYKTADSLQNKADKKFKELETSRTNTPKRLREANSKRIDADILKDKAEYYKALADAYKNDSIPEILKFISPVASKEHLYLFVKGFASGGGYYEAYRATNVRYKEYLERGVNNLKKYLIQYDINAITDPEQTCNEVFNELNKLANKDIQKETEEQQKQDKIKKIEDSWKFAKDKGFFPTPEKLAIEIVEDAEIVKGNTVLEPSAGLGHIAEIIRKNHPDNKLYVCEKMITLEELLKLKGFDFVCDDFLKNNNHYDRIIQNPPFENLQDIDHVKHAYSLLNTGGRLVSIMGKSAFFNSRIKAEEFRHWLNEVKAYQENLPEGSFKTKETFKQTGVSTVKVIIDKPAKPTTKIVDFKKKPDEQKQRKLKLAKAKAQALKLKLQLLNF